MRCGRMNATFDEKACIKFQDEFGRPECKGCEQGAEVRDDLGLPPLEEKKAPEPPETKYCSRCRYNKARAEFSPDKKSKDHLRTYCKTCTSALTMEYQHRKKNLAPLVAMKEKPSRKPPARRPIQGKLQVQTPIPVPDPSLKLTVFFDDYPNLLDFILNGPLTHLRSPENMVLYAVKRLYDEGMR